MKYEFTQSAFPTTQNALVVCEGTVTIRTVDKMNGKFSVFKRLFEAWEAKWKVELQNHLNEFFDKKSLIYTYKCFVKANIESAYGAIWGGIATVPSKANSIGLDPKRDYRADIEYTLAVRNSIEDALRYSVPLFIQPLGIDLYGWEPEEAAGLYVSSIADIHKQQRYKDTIKNLHLIIPLHDQSPDSHDQRFKKAFIEGMKKLNLEGLVDASAPKLQQDFETSKKELIKTLTDITVTLARNIAHQYGERKTSGDGHAKVQRLLKLAQQLEKTDDFFDFNGFVKDLEKTCATKRHALNIFKSKTDSTVELEWMRKEKGLDGLLSQYNQLVAEKSNQKN